MIKVISARFHLGVQIGAEVKTGYYSEKDKVDMFMNQIGVFIYPQKPGANPIFVPHSTINALVLDSSSLEKSFISDKKTKGKDAN